MPSLKCSGPKSQSNGHTGDHHGCGENIQDVWRGSAAQLQVSPGVQLQAAGVSRSSAAGVSRAQFSYSESSGVQMRDVLSP